jgi:hypothetical protein
MDYDENGNIYNLNNIWDYMEKDYWDIDDYKYYDFWGRMIRHNQIFYKVMELNGITLGHKKSGKDCTKKLLEEMKEKNKNYKVQIIWED